MTFKHWATEQLAEGFSAMSPGNEQIALIFFFFYPKCKKSQSKIFKTLKHEFFKSLI
jgi:hypothetical protein